MASLEALPRETRTIEPQSVRPPPYDMDEEKAGLSRPVSTVSGSKLEEKVEPEDNEVNAGELTLDEGALSLAAVLSMHS